MKYIHIFALLLLPYGAFANQTENQSNTAVGIIVAVVLFIIIMAIKSFFANRKKGNEQKNAPTMKKNSAVVVGKQHVSSIESAIKVDESHLRQELLSPAITEERAEQIYQMCKTDQVEELAKQVIAEKKRKAKDEQHAAWMQELQSSSITLERAREIYDTCSNHTDVDETASKLITQLIEKEMVTIPSKDRLHELLDLSCDDELDDRIQELLDQTELKDAIATVKNSANLSYKQIDELYQDAAENTFYDAYLFGQLQHVAMKEILQAEKVLYDPTSSESARKKAREFVDILIADDYSCAATTLAQEIADDDYGEDSYSYENIKQEILSPHTSLQRLQEISNDADIDIEDDYISELLTERIEAKILERLISIAQLSKAERDEREIEELYEATSSDSAAEIFANMLR